MFERMSLTACGGAGHGASNPLQVHGQDQGHQVCHGGLQGQHRGGSEMLAGQTQSAPSLGQGVHDSAVQRGQDYGWSYGSNPGGGDCLVLQVKVKPTDLKVRQNVVMLGNMEVLVNMVMDRVIQFQ